MIRILKLAIKTHGWRFNTWMRTTHTVINFRLNTTRRENIHDSMMWFYASNNNLGHITFEDI